MFLSERKTDRRGRPKARALSDRRTRALRRSIPESLAILLLLAFLAVDMLVRIPHTLALVGLRRPELTDVGRNLANLLLVDARHDDFRLGRCGKLDPVGRLVDHLVREAERKLQIR